MYKIPFRTFENTDKFRPAAIHFQQYGYYTSAPKGTTAYREYWDEERKRCLYGYNTEDGDRVTGYHYFYLNYCPIVLVKEIESINNKGEDVIKKDTIRDFPRFYDFDKYFFDIIEECENSGKHLAVLKSRRKGYSYKVGSMLNRNFYFIPDSKGYAIASLKDYLIKDGLLTKAWDMMDFIDEHTAWGKKRQKIDSKIHKRASLVVDKGDGIKTEIGYKSEIIGITLGNNPEAARGMRGKLMVFEEGGKFPNLKQAWQVARPSMEQGSITHGILIVFGTGGSEDSDFEGLKDIFYEPDAYGCLEIENVWEEENVLRPSGFYVPYTSNLDGGDENGNPFMDEQGNSLISSCKNYVLKERQKVISGASDRTMIDRYVAERCVTADTWVSYDGGIDRIVNIPGHFGNGKKDVYKLKTNDGTELFITDNHPVYNGTDYIRVKDLKEGDIIKHLPINFNKEYVSIPIESDFKFLKYDLKIDEEWAEFLGFYMGDGCFYGKSGAISIVFDDKDISSRERMYNFMLKYFGNVSIVKKKGCTSLQSTNKNYIKLFKSLDLVEKSSTNSKWHWKRKIHIPDYIVKSPKSVVAAFLRGLFDSDGHIIKSGRSIGFFSKYKHMCTAVQLLLRGFDINAKYKTRNSINGNGYNYIENKIVIRASDIEKFRNNIGFVSERKQQILNNYKPTWTTKDYSFTTVESITFDRIDEVYDLETQNHYYSANGLWVHNSLTPSEACLNVSTNIFPKEEMLNHLANLRNSTKLRELKQVGDLIFDGTGKVSWVPTNTPKDILKYRLKPNDDKNGQVVIWEHPIDNPPYGLYVLGCLTPGEKVLTHKGLMNVEDVTLEDKLINKDGEEVSINTLLHYVKKDEPVYKVHMSNVLRPTNYTQEHPLYVSNSLDSEFNFIRVGNVSEGMWTKYPNVYNKEKKLPIEIWNKYKSKRNNTDINPLEDGDFWWFVGHWLGDGFNHKQGINYTVYNSFGLGEDEYVEKYKNIVSRLFKRKPNLKLQNGSNTHKFEYKQLYLFLEDNFGKYAYGKYISEWVKYLPYNLKLQLILGYLDSDGSVYKDKTTILASFKSINKTLLSDIQDILFSLGIVSSLNLSGRPSTYSIKGKTGLTNQSYNLKINQTELKKLIDNFEIDYFSRKLRFAKQIKFKQKPRISESCILSEDNKYIYLKISKIESSIYTGIVYNFDCVTHSFVTQYCSTHNCDPYDHDKSTTNSLLSVYVYKRFSTISDTGRMVVAEYTGRPEFAEDAYEIVRKLALYYNGTIMYENQCKGLFPYFTHKHSEYLLADQPDIIKDIVKLSNVSRGKGIHMSKEIKIWMEGKIRQWLNEETSPGIKRLTTIMSEPLLEELISYNDKGNFDRVIAFGLTLIYEEELFRVIVKKHRKDINDRLLFREPIFQQEHFKF